jgi:hypothetical protein
MAFFDFLKDTWSFFTPCFLGRRPCNIAFSTNGWEIINGISISSIASCSSISRVYEKALSKRSDSNSR